MVTEIDIPQHNAQAAYLLDLIHNEEEPVEPFETGLLFFAFWGSSGVHHPPQPHILNGVIDTTEVMDILESYDGDGVNDDNYSQVIFSALPNGDVQFRIEIYQDGDFDMFDEEDLPLVLAIDRLARILQNGGRPYNVDGLYYDMIPVEA